MLIWVEVKLENTWVKLKPWKKVLCYFDFCSDEEEVMDNVIFCCVVVVSESLSVGQWSKNTIGIRYVSSDTANKSCLRFSFNELRFFLFYR
jgi:hypothetical protein